jgi:hypothetical protein
MWSRWATDLQILQRKRNTHKRNMFVETCLSVCRNCFTEIMFVCCCVQCCDGNSDGWFHLFPRQRLNVTKRTIGLRYQSLTHRQFALCSCLVTFVRAETGCEILGSRGACGMLHRVYRHIVADFAKDCSTFIFGVMEYKALRCLTLKVRAPLSTV